MADKKTVLVFAASNSNMSINRRLVLYAAKVLTDDIGADVIIDTLDLNEFEMPIYSSQREKADGIPQQAQDFFARIGSADGLIISYAEHNGFYSAAFKNIFDWCSRIDTKVFQDKPLIALSTSPGKRGGATVLAHVVASARHFGVNIRASLSVGSFGSVYDAQADKITDVQIDAALREALSSLRIE